MSLFDRYQQSNSTIIPQFEGSNGEDFIKVGQYRQGQYDYAREAGMETGDAAGNLNVSGSGLSGVDAAADDLRSEVSGKIQQFTEAGDWENKIPDVKALGRHFANRSAEIMAPINALATYKKSLDEKDLNLTPGQKSALVGMSVDAYNNSGGLQKNPRGQYQGNSIGSPAAKNIDVNKKVNEIIEGIAPSSQGYTRTTTKDGDMWIYKDGKVVKTLTKDQIASVVNAGLSNDEEYQAHVKQEGDIAGYYAGKYKDPSTAPDGPLKTQALQLQQQHPGLSFDQAFSHVASGATKQQIHDNAILMANKKNFTDLTTETGIKEANPYTKADYDQKLKADFDTIPVFIGRGPNTKANPDQLDYDKATTSTTALQGNVKQNNDNIKGWETALKDPKLTPEGRTQLQTNIAQTRNQNAILAEGITRSDQVATQSKVQAAQKLGFHDYNDFLKTGTVDIDKMISSTMGDTFSHIKTKSGRWVDRDEIKEAIATGRAKVTHFDPVFGSSATGASVSGVDLTLKDGTVVAIPNSMKGEQLGNAIDQMHNDNNSTLSKFNKNLKATYKDNVSNLSIGSSTIDLPNDRTREALTRMVHNDEDGITFVQPGQIEKQDAPKHYKVTGASTAGMQGEVRLKVEVLDDDGKPSGKYMEAVTSNNNFGTSISKMLRESSSPESQDAANAFDVGSTTRKLEGMTSGVRTQVPNGAAKPEDERFVTMTKGNNGWVWNLIKPDGTIIDTKSDAVQAAKWIDGPNKEHINPKTYAKRSSP